MLLINVLKEPDSPSGSFSVYRSVIIGSAVGCMRVLDHVTRHKITLVHEIALRTE